MAYIIMMHLPTVDAVSSVPAANVVNEGMTDLRLKCDAVCQIPQDPEQSVFGLEL